MSLRLTWLLFSICKMAAAKKHLARRHLPNFGQQEGIEPSSALRTRIELARIKNSFGPSRLCGCAVHQRRILFCFVFA